MRWRCSLPAGLCGSIPAGWDPPPPILLLGMEIIRTAPMGGTPSPICCWGWRSSAQHPWVGPPAEHPQVGPPPQSAAGDADQGAPKGGTPSTAPIGGTPPPQSAAGDGDQGAPMGGTPSRAPIGGTPPQSAAGDGDHQHSIHGWDPQQSTHRWDPPPPICYWGWRSGSTHRWDPPPSLLLGMQIISTAPMGGTPPTQPSPALRSKPIAGVAADSFLPACCRRSFCTATFISPLKRLNSKETQRHAGGGGGCTRGRLASTQGGLTPEPMPPCKAGIEAHTAGLEPQACLHHRGRGEDSGDGAE